MSDYKYRSLWPQKKTTKDKLKDLVWDLLPLLLWAGLGLIVVLFLCFCQQNIAFSHEGGLI